jgi:hypothetical protein
VLNTRLTYWRCATDQGQLIGYTQFLLEKRFVRAPSGEELSCLRAVVRQVTCSQCGAPIDLAANSSCPFCHTPISLIDPDGIAKAVRELSSSVADGTVPAASTRATAELHEAQMRAILDLDRIASSGGCHDLLSVGGSAIAGLLPELA